MNFLRIFFSVCSGTEIFPKLLELSLLRGFFHFVILSFVCASFIMAGKSVPLWRNIDRACAALSSAFGGLNITENGIFPSNAPEKSQSLALMEGLTLTYSPAGQEEKAWNDGNSKFGITWTPGIICGWLKVGGSDFIILPLLYPENVSIPKNPMTLSEGSEYIGKYSSSKGPFKFPFHEIDLGSMGPSIFLNLAFITFMVYFFKITVSAFLFTSIFAVIYSLIGRDELSQLPLKKLFIIGIYTAFPCIVIASFFPALELPFLDYQTVFLLCFLFYLFIVFNRIQRTLRPPRKPGRSTSDDDDDDF